METIQISNLSSQTTEPFGSRQASLHPEPEAFLGAQAPTICRDTSRNQMWHYSPCCYAPNRAQRIQFTSAAKD